MWNWWALPWIFSSLSTFIIFVRKMFPGFMGLQNGPNYRWTESHGPMKWVWNVRPWKFSWKSPNSKGKSSSESTSNSPWVPALLSFKKGCMFKVFFCPPKKMSSLSASDLPDSCWWGWMDDHVKMSGGKLSTIYQLVSWHQRCNRVAVVGTSMLNPNLHEKRILQGGYKCDPKIHPGCTFRRSRL